MGHFKIWSFLHYRSGTVNSKSFVGKDFLRIEWKYELIYACNSNSAKNFELEITLGLKLWIRNNFGL